MPLNICCCCCCSFDKLCPTFWDLMDCNTPGFPVLHYPLEFAQTHVYPVSDAMQPSHPLLSPSPPALNLSKHWSLFQWISSLHQVAKVLELQLQHWSFHMNIRGWFPLGLTGLISLQSKALLGVFSSTTTWKHPFFGTPPSLPSNIYMHTWLLEKPWLWLYESLSTK